MDAVSHWSPTIAVRRLRFVSHQTGTIKSRHRDGGRRSTSLSHSLALDFGTKGMVTRSYLGSPALACSSKSSLTRKEHKSF